MATAATATFTSNPEPQKYIKTLLTQIPIYKIEVVLTEFHKWYNEMNINIRSLAQTNHPDKEYEFPVFSFFEQNKNKTLKFDNKQHTSLMFDFIWTYAGRYHKELLKHIETAEDVKCIIDGDFEMGPAFNKKETQLLGGIFSLVREDQERFAKNNAKIENSLKNTNEVVPATDLDLAPTAMKPEDSISTVLGSIRIDKNVLQDIDCKVAEGRYLW